MDLIVKLLLIVVTLVVLAFVTGGIVAWLWNFLPFLAAIQHMTWLQGTALVLLTGILFRTSVGSS